MSQMRQLVLQIALAKGYSGVKDLEKHSANIKTKGFVQKAVLETDLNMAIPATFTNKAGKQEKLMKKFAETHGVKQIYAQVRGLPSVEEGDKKVNGLEQFRQSVKKMGMKRAFRLALPKDLPREIVDLIKPNNRKIGVESKDYPAYIFDYGMKQSNDMREKFKAICEKNGKDFKENYYEITNDLLFIKKDTKKDSKGEWVECTKEDAFNSPDIVLSTSRALEAYFRNKDRKDIPGLEPNDFSKKVHVKYNGKQWQEVEPDDKGKFPEGTKTLSSAAWKFSRNKMLHNLQVDKFENFLIKYIKDSDLDLNKYTGSVISKGGHDAREKDQKDPNEEKISTINAAYRALKGEKKSAVAAPAAPATGTHAAPPVLGRSASVSAGSLAKEPKLDKVKSSGLFSRLARSASAVVPRKNPASKTVPSGSDSDSLSGSSEIFNSNPLYSLDSSPIQSNSPSLNSSSDSLSTSSSSLGSDTESTDKYNGKNTPTSPVSQIPPVLKSNQESSDELPEVFPPLPDIPGELPDTVSQQLPPLPSIPQGSPMEKLASMLASAPPPPRPLRTDLGETIPGQIRQNTSVADEALNDERKTPINFRAQAPRVSTSLQSSPVQNGQQIVAQNPSFPVPNRPPPLPPINKANSAGQDALAVHSAPVLGAMGPKKERRPRVFGTVEELEQAANQARIQIAATKAIEVQVPENKGSNELSTRKNGLK
jgi:hypothetical protein